VAEFVTGHGLPGCAAGVVIDGELAWSHGFGFADRATGRRPDAGTLFRIASISKTFTATAVLQLRDAGRLRLDDPLVAHLPEARAITNPFGPVEDVTIRRLLLHTSGLQGEQPFDDPRVERWGDLATVVADLPRLRVVVPPDTRTKYCNVAFQLLGALVQRHVGRPFAEHVTNAILDPLGLTATAYDPEVALVDRCATGYDARRLTDDLVPARRLDSRTFEADGGLWSCVDDLARYIAFQLGPDDDVLAETTRAEMRRPWIVGDAGVSELQGLCWYWTRHGADWFVGHAGSVNGFTSRIAMSPPDGAGSIVLFNGIGDASALAGELLAIAVEEPRSRPLPQPAPPLTAAPAVAALVGRYEDPESAEVAAIEWRDGGLWLVESGAADRLRPTADADVWVVDDGGYAGETFRFLRDAAGRVDGANIGGYPRLRR
jgi:CubicO group peptidase (beta-lactamase class C family)